MSKIKPFEHQGQYTQVHNIVFDKIMPSISPVAFKVLMAIIRKTKGWHKNTDRISESQMVFITGIKSGNTIRKAAAELVKAHIIICTPGDWTNPNMYGLNLDYEIEADGGTSKNEDTKETLLKKVKNNYSDDLNKFYDHFEKLGHVFTKPQTKNAIVAAIGKYGVSDTIAAYERAIENGAENVGIYAAGILRNGGVKSNGREPQQTKLSEQQMAIYQQLRNGKNVHTDDSREERIQPWTEDNPLARRIAATTV